MPRHALLAALLLCAACGGKTAGQPEGRLNLSGDATALSGAAGFTVTWQIVISYLNTSGGWTVSYTSPPITGSSLAQVGACVDTQPGTAQDGLATVTIVSVTSNDPNVQVVGWSGSQSQPFACIAEKDSGVNFAFHILTEQAAFGFDDIIATLDVQGHDTSSKLECRDGFPATGTSSLVSGFADDMSGQQAIVNYVGVSPAPTPGPTVYTGFSDPGALPSFGFSNVVQGITDDHVLRHFERLAFVMPTPLVKLNDSVAAYYGMDLGSGTPTGRGDEGGGAVVFGHNGGGGDDDDGGVKTDAGSADAGKTDAGSADAGSADAGSADAGSGGSDGGTTGGGSGNCTAATCCKNKVRSYVMLSTATIVPATGASCAVTNRRDTTGADLWQGTSGKFDGTLSGSYTRTDLSAALGGVDRVISSCTESDCSAVYLLYTSGGALSQAKCTRGSTCQKMQLYAQSCLR